MVNLIIYGIAGLIILAMFLIIKIKSSQVKNLKNEIAQKDFAIERAAQNIKALMSHGEALKDIQKNHNDYIKRIGKVKEGDVEEINNILTDIITANNKRVQNR